MHVERRSYKIKTADGKRRTERGGLVVGGLFGVPDVHLTMGAKLNVTHLPTGMAVARVDSTDEGVQAALTLLSIPGVPWASKKASELAKHSAAIMAATKRRNPVAVRRRNRPTYDELEQGGPALKFLSGCNARTIVALAGIQGRLSAAEVAAETTDCKISSVRQALKALTKAGYVKTWRSRGGFDQRATMYEATEKGLELAAEIQRLGEQRIVEQFETALDDTSFDPTAWGSDAPGEDVPTAERLTYEVLDTDAGGKAIEAYDVAAGKRVGRLELASSAADADDERRFAGHEGDYAPILSVRVHPSYRRAGVGTRLYELAAAEAEKLGLPLASPDDRTRGESAFWRKQERKRRARARRTRERPSASRYFLEFPPPVSLNPPMTCPACQQYADPWSLKDWGTCWSCEAARRGVCAECEGKGWLLTGGHEQACWSCGGRKGRRHRNPLLAIVGNPAPKTVRVPKGATVTTTTTIKAIKQNAKKRRR